MRGVRPGRGASFSSPLTPDSRNRARHRADFCTLIPNSSAISLSCLPAAALNTMRARSTTREGNERARLRCSKASLCSGFRSTLGATRIGEEPPLYVEAHPALYTLLLMTHYTSSLMLSHQPLPYDRG